MPRKKKTPELITLKEACKILHVHPNTLRAWDKKGILKAVRFGLRKDRKYTQKSINIVLNSKYT